MKRIVIHWTASTGQPNHIDYEHYHFLINEAGLLIKGKHAPEDNLNCQDGNYAAHTGGGNTGSIGIAMCGMLDFNGNPNSTKYPLTPVQCETCFLEVAKLCKRYKIEVSPDTVLTHYEFGKKHPKTSSSGKIDIIYLPPYKFLEKDDVGNFIRNKVNWYLLKL